MAGKSAGKSAAKPRADEEVTASRNPEETPEERVERKAKEYAGPVAKPRKEVIKPQLQNLYPWAANRGKIERAHTYVSAKGSTDENPRGDAALREVEAGTPEFEQAVMDHYTLHGGLVIGQEKATVIGRKKLGRWHPGATTTEVVGQIDDEGGADLERGSDKTIDEDDD